jgi:hypothetical protein
MGRMEPSKIILSHDEFVTIMGGIACQRLGIPDEKIHAEVNMVKKDGYLHFVEVTISDWRGE